MLMARRGRTEGGSVGGCSVCARAGGEGTQGRNNRMGCVQIDQRGREWSFAETKNPGTGNGAQGDEILRRLDKLLKMRADAEEREEGGAHTRAELL